MSVPRMNEDEARGFRLACDAMALEGAVMEVSRFPAETTARSNHMISTSEAHNKAGTRMREFATHLEATSYA